MRISFDVDLAKLAGLRRLELTLPYWKGTLPPQPPYDPVRAFLSTHQRKGYPFRLIKLLHAAGVKMLQLPRVTRLSTTLWATGGLFLALDKTHNDLAFERSFGDFTSGFSHAIGVALAMMTMSEAYCIGWDRFVPVAVSRTPTLDYEARLSTGGWLHLEAKGASSRASRNAARRKIVGKKPPATQRSAQDAMIGVIAQTAQSLGERGCIEIVDPDFPVYPELRREEAQLAARYEHYAAVARFAGLSAVSEVLESRASSIRNGEEFSRSITLGISPVALIERRGIPLVGLRWNFSNEWVLGDNQIWFHHAVDARRLRWIVEQNRFPEALPWNSDSQQDIETASDTLVESFLSDGSYFAVGLGDELNLPVADSRRAEELDDLGLIEVRQS